MRLSKSRGNNRRASADATSVLAFELQRGLRRFKFLIAEQFAINIEQRELRLLRVSRGESHSACKMRAFSVYFKFVVLIYSIVLMH